MFPDISGWVAKIPPHLQWALLTILILPVFKEQIVTLSKWLAGRVIAIMLFSADRLALLASRKLPWPFLYLRRLKLSSRPELFRGLISDVEPFPADKIFVDLTLRRGGEAEGRTLRAALDQHQILILLGGAGTGKTTLTRHYVSLINRGELFSGTKIAVMLRLRQIARDGLDLTGHLARQIFGDITSNAEVLAVRRWLDAGQLVIVFDGLDEVSGSPNPTSALQNENAGPVDRGRLIHALINFIQPLLKPEPACKVLLTCREAAYADVDFRDLQERAIFRVQSLDDTQIQTFLRGWPEVRGRRAGDLWPKLDLLRDVKLSCANPLLLTLLTELYLTTPSSTRFHLPETRQRLFEKAFEETIYCQAKIPGCGATIRCKRQDSTPPTRCQRTV